MTAYLIHRGPSDACSESAKCCEWCLDRNRSLLLLWEYYEIAGPLITQEITYQTSRGIWGALYILMTSKPSKNNGWTGQLMLTSKTCIWWQIIDDKLRFVQRKRVTDVHRSLYCSVSVWTCPLFLKLAITRRPAPHSLLQSTGRKISLRRARSSSSTKVQSDSAGARLLPQPTPFHTCVLCVCPGERGRERLGFLGCV